MSERKYNWLRFWAPRDGKVGVNAYGALEDPHGSYGHVLNPEAKTLEALNSVRCLVLLGEPGTGKSEELKQQLRIFPDTHPDDSVLLFQLRDYQTDIKLCRDIFDNPVLRSWVNGDHDLYLYLDSLDEGLLTVNTLANLLVQELKQYPTERLYIRIACRTAEWPGVLEAGLKEQWGEENFKAYELLPLREKDIHEAASSEGVDPKKFFEELARRQVGPLAIKPVTLKFLLKLFVEHAELPHTQAKLYAEGCRYLCEESNQSRIDSHRRGRLTTKQRLQVAQRIAAISIFANKSAVWMGLLSDMPDGDVAIEDLASGTEGNGHDGFHIGEDEIREALSTGLFNSRGQNRMGWAHQTYAEFLGATFLIERGLSFDQKVGLISNVGETPRKIIPQLHETASWLASMDQDVFRHIMKTDPVVLLRSDVASADPKDRAALVQCLLESADNEEWIDRDWSVHQFYSNLSHAVLGEQLRPFITDNRRGYFARRIATDIAEACDVKTLQDELAQLALDQTEDIDLRVNAAYAVVRIGDSQTKARLRPLAIGEAGDDPADELKGRGLRAIWPDHLSSDELFSLLTYPKRPSLYGSYKSFLDALAKGAEVIDLVVALRWLREKDIHPDPVSPFRSLRNEILRRAWENLDVMEIREALADLIVDHVRKLRGDDDEKIVVDSLKRRKLLESVIPRITASEKPTPWYFLVYDNHLVDSTDVPWLIERIVAEKSPATQTLLADMIGHVLDWRNTDHVGLIIDASANNSILANTFRLFLNPVYLDSEQAAAQRKAYSESQEWNRKIPEKPSLDPPAKERVKLFLERFEAGDVDAWWRLNLEMTLHEDSPYYGHEAESDLKKEPGWKAATDEVKARIVECAKKYICNGDPEPKKWLGKKIRYRPAYAGYRAFRLLQTEDPPYISTLLTECWRKWACALVAYPFQNEVSDAEVQIGLIEYAYQYAPDEVIRTVLALIDCENKTDGFISLLSHLKNCWDEPLCAALMNRIKQRRFKTNCLGQILSELLENDSLEAKRYAEAIVKRKPASAKGHARRLMAARVLVTHADDSGWKTVWPGIRRDSTFGRQVVEAFAGSVYRRQTSVAGRLNEEELADLFIWLAREYSYDTDPRHEGVYAVGPNDEARSFRNSVLSQLKERGTPSAVAALEKLVRELTELPWLKWTLVEAQEVNRRRNWVPLQPSEILRIADDDDSRLVQNGEQLLRVVVESLQRLQQKLHGETPAAIDLWNEVNTGVYQPRDENRLSDYVKRHFDEDLKARGIVANREVQIRRGDGSFKGQETDIHIDAITRNASGDIADQITAIVETKGCWNPDLEHAMETQLKNRYLKDHHSPFGLYLVGWFNCAQWNDTDPRKRRSPKISLDEARDKFNEQAASLSTNDTKVTAFVLDASLSSADTI
jgi:predicted NACHT family NTPase